MPQVRHQPRTADDELDAHLRNHQSNVKSRQKPPVVSSPRATAGKPPTINKGVGKPKSPVGSLPPGGKSHSPIWRQNAKMVVDESDIPLVGASAVVHLSGASAAGTVGQHATAQPAAMAPLALVDNAMASLGSTTSSSGYVVVGAQTPHVVVSPKRRAVRPFLPLASRL